MNYKQEVLKVYPDAVVEDIDYGRYLIVNHGEIISWGCLTEKNAWKSAYTYVCKSVPTPTTITVTGCGDCPMYSVMEQSELCAIVPKSDNIHHTCPLKTSPITIMLKPQTNDTKTD